MRKQSWVSFLRFSQWLTCLAVVTSLWGCGTPYVINPSASGLPSSLQVQMEAERTAIPDELQTLLKKTLTTQSCRVKEPPRPDPRLIGQTVPTTSEGLQLQALGAVTTWILEVSRDPSPKRLEHRKKLFLPEPGTWPALPAMDPEKPFWDEDRKEYTKGFAFGAVSGAVPLASQSVDVGIELKLLPKGTYWARVGRACGELAIGTGHVILGCAGIGAGMGATGTGGGAPAGIMLIAGSTALTLNGCATAAHGAGDLIQLMREGDSPTVDPAPPAPTPAPAPKPAAPAKPAQPVQAQPAKPAQAAPVETTTTTYNRTTRVTETRTESGTTTITKPRVKGKPSGDAPKDVAKGAKRGPKTDPDAPHNAAVRKEGEKLQAEGNEIVAGGGIRKEKLIKTEGGLKEGRRPDIIYKKPGEPQRGRNVGKTNADGTPVKREQEALDDLNKHGDTPTDFVPYDR